MEKLNRIGLPVVVIIMVTFIVLVKSAVNIGYGEAGVLFRTFGGGVVTDEPALGSPLFYQQLYSYSPIAL